MIISFTKTEKTVLREKYHFRHISLQILIRNPGGEMTKANKFNYCGAQDIGQE